MSNRNNLIGETYGKLKIIDYAEDYVSPKGKHGAMWLCQCECGNIKKIRESDLRSGRTKSCGMCVGYKKQFEVKKQKPKYRDITGQKFGRLTALYHAGSAKDKSALWMCKCDCGNEKVVTSTALLSGKTSSCGCLKREVAKDNSFKHGETKTRLYREWQAMKERCYRKTHQYYNRYGGRGISVCDEWKCDYLAFKKWAIENGYSDNLSLDRIDNDGNYCPENCRWATWEEQANNRSNNVVVFYEEKWLPINIVMNKLNKKYGYVYQHYRNLGLLKKM